MQSELKVLIPPPSIKVGGRVLSLSTIARGRVMTRPTWRSTVERVHAWLVLEEQFAQAPEGPWAIAPQILLILAEEFRCLEQDLSQISRDEYRQLMLCIHCCDVALLREPAAAPEPAPEGAAETAAESENVKTSDVPSSSTDSAASTAA